MNEKVFRTLALRFLFLSKRGNFAVSIIYLGMKELNTDMLQGEKHVSRLRSYVNGKFYSATLT
jgi:hypothetical protein